MSEVWGKTFLGILIHCLVVCELTGKTFVEIRLKMKGWVVGFVHQTTFNVVSRVKVQQRIRGMFGVIRGIVIIARNKLNRRRQWQGESKSIALSSGERKGAQLKTFRQPSQRGATLGKYNASLFAKKSHLLEMSTDISPNDVTVAARQQLCSGSE